LIHEGRNILYGPLNQIQRAYSGDEVLVRVDGQFPQIQGVQAIAQKNGTVHLTLTGETTPQQVLEQLIREQAIVEQFEIATPTLDEIFIRAVQGDVTVSGGA
jgi:ABC-2 type transport system ATP-binding protein